MTSKVPSAADYWTIDVKMTSEVQPAEIIESLTSKIIEPMTEKTWAQGCVIQQREKWSRVEFTSLSEENILNE